MSTSTLMYQMLDAQNDLAVVATFLACLYYGVRFARCGQCPDLVLSATALGILVGVKYYAVGYGVLVGAAVLLLTLVSRGTKAAGAAGLIFATGIIVFGGYWYTRNIWITGTPFYPKGFTQSTDLTGRIRSTYKENEVGSGVWSSTLLLNGNPEVPSLLVQTVWVRGGPLHITGFILFPFTCAWLLVSGWHGCRRSKHFDGCVRITFAFLTMAAAIAWSLIPFAVETIPGTLNMLRTGFSPTRFGLCFLTLACLILGVVIQDISRWLRQLALPCTDDYNGSTTHSIHSAVERACRFVVVILSYLCQAAFAGAVVCQYSRLAMRLPESGSELLFVASTVFVAGFAFVLCKQIWPNRSRQISGLCCLGSCAFAAFAAHELSERWREGFAARYDTMFDTDAHATLARIMPSSVQISVLDYRYYPFFGCHRQFDASRPLWIASYSELLAHLRNHHSSYVVVLNDGEANDVRYKHKNQWIRDHPDVFIVIQHTGRYILARIDPDGLAAATAINDNGGSTRNN